MKATGIIRRIDNLGRIVIAKETRDMLGIKEGTPMEVFVDGEMIILRKYQPNCTVCGESNDLVPLLAKYGIKICQSCYQKASETKEVL